MSEALTPKELAAAAAQGVMIAMNSRKAKPEATRELLARPVLICGIPSHLFEVELKPASDGSFSIGSVNQRTEH